MKRIIIFILSIPGFFISVIKAYRQQEKTYSGLKELADFADAANQAAFEIDFANQLIGAFLPEEEGKGVAVNHTDTYSDSGPGPTEPN